MQTCGGFYNASDSEGERLETRRESSASATPSVVWWWCVRGKGPTVTLVVVGPRLEAKDDAGDLPRGGEHRLDSLCDATRVRASACVCACVCAVMMDDGDGG